MAHFYALVFDLIVPCFSYLDVPMSANGFSCGVGDGRLVLDFACHTSRWVFLEADAQTCSVKKVFQEIS